MHASSPVDAQLGRGVIARQAVTAGRPRLRACNLSVDEQRARTAIDDVLLHLRACNSTERQHAAVRGARRRNTREGHAASMCARAFAMLCDTSYTTCMSRSSGVLLNIFANAYSARRARVRAR
jgi:hypothetical protein